MIQVHNHRKMLAANLVVLVRLINRPTNPPPQCTPPPIAGLMIRACLNYCFHLVSWKKKCWPKKKHPHFWGFCSGGRGGVGWLAIIFSQIHRAPDESDLQTLEKLRQNCEARLLQLFWRMCLWWLQQKQVDLVEFLRGDGVTFWDGIQSIFFGKLHLDPLFGVHLREHMSKRWPLL